MELLDNVIIGNINKVKELLLNGADVNFKDEDGNTSLIIASRYGFSEIIKVLILNNADINLRNNNGNSSLNIASLYCHYDIVKVLLLNGADVNIKNNDGYTSLMSLIITSYKDISEIVKVLLFYNADVNIINKYGNTSLILSSQYGNLEAVKILAPIANIYHVNNLGYSAFTITRNDKIIGELCKYTTKMISLKEHINNHIINDINDINDYLL